MTSTPIQSGHTAFNTHQHSSPSTVAPVQPLQLCHIRPVQRCYDTSRLHLHSPHSLQKNQTETLKLNIQLLGQLFQGKIDPMHIIALLFHLFHPANGLWLLAMMARDLSRNPMWFPCADAALPDRTSSASHASWPSG